MWIGSDATTINDKHYRKAVDNPEYGWSAFFIQVGVGVETGLLRQ